MVFLKFLSRWPLWLLYRLSDFFFVLIFYVLGYRKKVVLENLKIAFPEKTLKERKEISKKFYRHFCDVIVEFFAINSMSEKELEKRVRVTNLDFLKAYFDEGKTVIAVVCHHNNWEWMLQRACITLNIPFDAVYQKLSNKKVDDFILETRSRFGGLPIEMNKTFKEIIKRRGTVRGFCMVADQSPRKNKCDYYVDFFGQETPFYTGMASIHKMTGYPLIYANMRKLKRGYYEISMELINERPEDVEENEVVDRYVALVEHTIRNQPETYLWTHKRWKHAR